MFDKIFSGTKYLERGLDASAMRSQVISNNIANAETPGFKSSSVDFESQFQEALAAEMGSSFDLKKTREKHIDFSSDIDSVHPSVRLNYNTNMRMDDNNVDIDYQNSQMAKNQLYYSTLVQKLNSEFAKLRAAIGGGA